jgi:hypothetical protein
VGDKRQFEKVRDCSLLEFTWNFSWVSKVELDSDFVNDVWREMRSDDSTGK